MICPYIRKRETLVLQWDQEQDNEEGKTNCQEIQRTEYTMMECPQEGCAVWHDGRCRYAAVSLENE